MATTSDDRDRANSKHTSTGLETRYWAARNFPPMSQWEFLNEAIRFANASPDGEEQWRFLPLRLGVKLPYKKFKKVRKQTRRASDYQQERNAFRISLTEIARGDELSHPKETTKAAGRMLLIPHASLERQQLQIKYQYLPQDLAAALAYVLLLLVDSTKGHGRNLSQCQLDRCQKFFFAVRPKTGRPRTKYCSDEHMHEAHQATAPLRVKKSRAKRRLNKTNLRAKR